MKKVILLFTINLFIFSCSENELSDSSKDIDNVLVNKIVAVWTNGTVEVIDFVYEGNKLLRMEALNNNSTTFHYDATGLLTGITKNMNRSDSINTSFVYNANNELMSYTHFYYNTNNNIDTENKALKFEIQTQNDNYTALNVYKGDHNSQTDFLREEIVTYNNGNRIQENNNVNYFYDNKNGLFKNIHALKTLRLLNNASLNGIHINTSYNNVSGIKNSSDGEETIVEYDYSYNDDNYPKRATYKVDGQLQADIEYFLSK